MSLYIESTGVVPAWNSTYGRKCSVHTLLSKYFGIHTFKKISLALDFAGFGFTNKYRFWVQHLPLAAAWLNVDGPL